MSPARDLGAVLVVGGTGMLAAATRALAAQATSLTLIARAPDALARELSAPTVALDWSAPGATDRIAALEGRFDTALVWLHDEAAALSRPIEDALRPGGRLVRVMGSLAMDPAIRDARAPDPRADIARQLVILGWHHDPAAPGGQRWLSHAEICAGVLAAVRAPTLEALIIGGSGG